MSTINARPVVTITTREQSVGFSLRAFTSDVVLNEYIPLIEQINEYYYDPEMDAYTRGLLLMKARAAFAQLVNLNNSLMSTPFRVKESQAKVSRMSRSIGSDIFGIDYSSRKPCAAWITVEHSIQAMTSFNWRVASANKKDAYQTIEALQKAMYYRLGNAGLVMERKDGTQIHYYGFAASASHQKKEKLVMADGELMKLHEEAIWFGLTFKQFLQLSVNGAAIWKMRANILRPIRKALKTADGRNVYLHDIIMKDDISANRHYPNARKVGEVQPDGSIFVDCEADEDRTIDDGGIHYLIPMNNMGQLTSFGLKGMGSDMTSAIEVAAHLEGKEIPDFGGKLLMMGAGCWKFDKLGISFDEYVAKVDALADRYPGINQVWLLREGEEVDGNEKIRRLTRSLIQQWIDISDLDIRKLTSATRRSLLKVKTLKGAIDSLRMGNIPESDRPEIAKLFGNAPWLVLNENVQDYLAKKWTKKQATACGNKLRTTGSYPYIQEDLVAVAQIQIFGADPNRSDLGVLKAGEMSVAGVEEGQKMLAVRFPANYLTARVRVNKPCAEAFASCGNIAMISIYDDILVVQDGDVDGDEMAIILNDIAIAATERMIERFNPPTILFQHGSKAPKVVLGTRAHAVQTMYEDLWKAKKFDSVGKYANLSTLCAHLASLAYREGDMASVQQYLDYMSLASTGAILAIDQVKGNAVSPALIAKLDEVGKTVRGLCGHLMPWTQQYVKGISAEACMARSDALCDRVGGVVLDETGDFELEVGSCKWNLAAARKALLDFGVRTTSVRRAPVGKSFFNALTDNWFNDKNQADADLFAKIRAGEAVGQEELIDLLWRNACALEFRMEGANLEAKREQYYQTVRTMLYDQACSTSWISADNHVFTESEKKASVVNSAVSFILKNKVDGSRAMFVLKVFAKELNWCVTRSSEDGSSFFFECDDANEEELYSAEEGIVESDEPEFNDSAIWFGDDDEEEGYFLI